MSSSTGRLRLPKTRRLTQASEYERVKASGNSLHGRLMVLGILIVEGDMPFRSGIVTSRKIGDATVRNRLRRRMRDMIRTEQQRVRGGLWLVMIARRPAANASYAMLKDEWLRLAERASILAP
jgi:ribonuclease P protein component